MLFLQSGGGKYNRWDDVASANPTEWTGFGGVCERTRIVGVRIVPPVAGSTGAAAPLPDTFYFIYVRNE